MSSAVPSAERPDTSSPVYVSFRTLLNLIERMEREGMPGRLDKGYLSHMAGGVQNLVLLAMRSLGLIDDELHPLDPLRDLVSRKDDRKQFVREMLEREYDWALRLGPNATHLQLDEAFRAHGERLSPNTREKAITFFLHAAEYAGLHLSPFYKRKSSGAQPAPAQRRVKRAPRGSGSRPSKQEPARPEPLPPTDDADMRRRYFEVLLKKAQDSDQLDEGLLNRIEKLIGLGEVMPMKG